MAQTILEEKKKSRLMTEGSIWKSILLFSVPLILGNMLQQLYNTADSIIVGNFVGSNALAAVGSSGSPIFLLIGFSQGIAVVPVSWCPSFWSQGQGGRAHCSSHLAGPFGHSGCDPDRVRHCRQPGPAHRHEHPRRGAGGCGALYTALFWRRAVQRGV